MPGLDSVQSGSLTITSGSGTTVNVTISSVDTSRAIPMFTFRSADVNYRDARHLFRASLSSSTNLRLIRQEAASATSIELYWTVVEFDSAWGGSIQAGSVACDADPEDITISAVDLDATFPLLYWSTDDFTMTNVCQPRPIFTSTTNLSIQMQSTPSGNDCIVQYHVVEFDPADVTVQSGTASALNNYNNDVTISSVDTGKTLVLAWSDATAGAAGRNYARTYLASATSIEADLQNRGTAPDWNNTWYAVEMLDSSVVEHGTVAIADASTTPGTAPSWGSAMTDGAVFFHKSQPNVYVTTTTNDSHFPNSVQASFALDSPQDSLTVVRHGSTNAVNHGWQVIEWAAASGVTGTVNYTNANDTLAASGTTTVTGTLATTNANDTSAASGTTTVAGSLATTNANDTLAASGAVGDAVTGTVSYTNANDTLAAAGTTTVVGALAYTNANDTLASSGTTTVTGALAYTNANDTLAASGAAGAVTGTVDYTNDNDALQASGEAGSGQIGGHFLEKEKPKRKTKTVRESIEEVLSPPTEVIAEQVREALQTPKFDVPDLSDVKARLDRAESILQEQEAIDRRKKRALRLLMLDV
jgi:hypothetical protein